MIRGIENIKYQTKERFIGEMKMETSIVGLTADVGLEGASKIKVFVKTDRLLNRKEIEELINEEVRNIKGCESLKQDNEQKEIGNLNVELDFHNDIVKLDKEDITIRKVARIKHILNEISKWNYLDIENIDNAIEDIKTLDSKLPGRNYLYELKLGSNTMTYSDEFVENMLKDEYIKHLKDEQDKIEAMKQLKELDIKVPSMEELKEICDMGYDMHDINRFISKTYKDWDMKPCCTLEYLKDSL